MVFRSDGHILTTADAVSGAESLTVVTSTGSVLPAALVGTDASSDVAVLHVDAENLPTAVLGHVDQVAAGDPTLGVAPTADPSSGPSVVEGTVTSTGTRVDLPDGQSLHDMITATLDSTGVVPGTVLCAGDGSVVGRRHQPHHSRHRHPGARRGGDHHRVDRRRDRPHPPLRHPDRLRRPHRRRAHLHRHRPSHLDGRAGPGPRRGDRRPDRPGGGADHPGGDRRPGGQGRRAARRHRARRSTAPGSPRSRAWWCRCATVRTATSCR